MSLLHDLLRFVADTTTDTPAGSVGSDNQIATAIITVIGGGILSLIGTFILVRSGRRIQSNDVDNAGGGNQPIIITDRGNGDPDEEYRDLLKENAAYRLFLALRGFNPDRIIRGTEPDIEAKD